MNGKVVQLHTGEEQADTLAALDNIRQTLQRDTPFVAAALIDGDLCWVAPNTSLVDVLYLLERVKFLIQYRKELEDALD